MTSIQESVPVGWENRKNSELYESEDKRPATNSEKFKEKGPQDQTVPAGWSSRYASMAICDLTKSGDSTDIAAAEVHLRAAGISNDQVMFAPPNIGLEGIVKRDRREVGKSNDVESGPESVNHQTTQLLNMLAAAVVQMDSRMRSLESSVATLCQRTEEIQNLQHKIIEVVSKK